MEEDRGVYQCVASLVVAGGDQRQAAANGRLSVIRKFCFLFTVLELQLSLPLLSSPSLPSLVTPPTIITEPTSDLLVFVGVAVSLPCTASGFPPPVFTWARGGGTPVDLQNSEHSSNCGNFRGVFISFLASFFLYLHTIFLISICTRISL